MRRWFPTPGEESLDEVYADLPGDAPWVALDMVVSLDGQVTIDGTSRALGGEGDLAAFRALRAAADVVLVGAGTARVERYGPPRLSPVQQARRRDRGQADRPAIAVVSRSLDLDINGRLLAEDPDFHPIVCTCTSSPIDRRAALEDHGADVVVAGDDEVDLAAALDALRTRGLTRVVAEGGPSLNVDLLTAGLVDELFVTLDARLVGGSGPGMVARRLPVPVTLRLLEGRFHGDELLLRYAIVHEGDR